MMTMVVREQIGIFQGKKGEYNKLVLKTLYESGYLKPWEMAKKIADLKRKPKTNWYQETQKVQSVLLRTKGGRLRELLDKEYLKKTAQGYYLTDLKGFCSALTLYDKAQKPAINPYSKSYELFPELAQALEIISGLHPEAKLEEKSIEIMNQQIKKLLEKGFNLDAISNEEFNMFFNDSWQLSALQEFTEEGEKEEKWETPPEVRKLVIRTVDRLRDAIRKQLEAFDSLEERYASLSGSSMKGELTAKRRKDEIE